MFTNRKQNTLRKAKAGLVSFGALAIGLVANAGIVSAEAYTPETWKATTVQEMKQEIGNAVENGGTVKAQWGWTISVLSEATGISEENLLKIASNFESKSLIFSEQTHGQGATIFEFSKKEAVVVSNENTTLATDGYVTETQQQVTVTQPSGEQATVVIKTDTKGEQTIVNTPIDNGVSEAVVAFDKNDMKPTDETAPAVKPTVKPVETKPVKPVETAPVKPVETAPVKPVETTPVKPEVVKPKVVEHRETKELNFETETRQTNELFKDEKRVVRKGVKGSQVIITKVTTLNGKEINREVVNGERVEPISEIIEVGTKERDVAQPKTVEHRETKELDFETETKYRDDLFTDERYTIRKGVKGSQVVITRVTTLNGKEINREVVNGERVEPISEIIEVGTKERDVAQPKTVEHRETKELNFETETRQTNELFTDEKRVVRKGVKGSQVILTKVTTLNGKEINREVINGERVEPISEIIEVGTKERDVSQPKTVEHRETKELNFETETIYNDELFTDERYLFRKGVKGSQVVITRVTTLNGKEINREVVNGERVEPISEIIEVGTQERGIALGTPEFLKLMDEKFSQEKLNAKFLELVNAERSKLGLHALKQSTQAAKAAKLRAKEQVEYGSLDSFGKAHIRPNNKDFSSIREEVRSTPGYYYMTENLIGATLSQLMNIEDEEAVAQHMFTRWKNSPGHYASMMHSRAQLVGVGVQHAPGLLGAGFYGAMLIETERK